MVKIREINLSNKYLGWFLFIYVLLICVSIFYAMFKKDFYIIWFYIIHPTAWIIFYIVLSYREHIFERSTLLLGVPSIILIFIFDMILFKICNSEILQIIIPIIIISVLIFIGICFLSLFVGFVISLIITKVPEINEADVKNNSVSFQLEGDESQKKATNNLLSKAVIGYLGYPFWTDGQRNYEVYIKLNPFSVKRLFITSDMDKITFYPFIKDGFYQEPNPRIIPLITVIGKFFFNLKTSNVGAETLFPEFLKHMKPNKILRLLKNVHHRDIAIVGILIFVVMVVLILSSYPEFVIINLNTLLYNVLFWSGSAIFGIIIKEIWENRKQSKSK